MSSTEHAAPLQIRSMAGGGSTAVDDYWGEVTVNSKPFTSAEESIAYLKWRSSIYPLFAGYMDLHLDHSGETVLDYGCGPGDDTTEFALNSNAAKVIAMDVSPKALGLTRGRLSLHQVDPGRVDLVQTSDSNSVIPIEDDSVDFINCGGVLHHVTHPGRILREFRRVLRPGGSGRIMVYNRDSIFFHLWVAYQRQLINGDFRGLSADSAFSRSTDGELCPISRAYRPPDFCELCLAAGLEVDFAGGYFAQMELDLMREKGNAAIADERLGAEHREFLRSLTSRDDSFFYYQDRTAGHGGVYRISKR